MNEQIVFWFVAACLIIVTAITIHIRLTEERENYERSIAERRRSESHEDGRLDNVD